MKKSTTTTIIKKGLQFVANSKKKPALWYVTKAVLSGENPRIYAVVILGAEGYKKYSLKQFKYLLARGILTPIVDEEEAIAV